MLSCLTTIVFCNLAKHLECRNNVLLILLEDYTHSFHCEVHQVQKFAYLKVKTLSQSEMLELFLVKPLLPGVQQRCQTPAKLSLYASCLLSSTRLPTPVYSAPRGSFRASVPQTTARDADWPGTCPSARSSVAWFPSRLLQSLRGHHACVSKTSAESAEFGRTEEA